MLTFGRLAFGCAVLAAVLAAGPSAADWRQFRGDSARTGRAIWDGTGLAAGMIVWQRAVSKSGAPIDPPELPDMIDASPVVGPDDTIYVTTTHSGRSLVAFNPDGSEKWAIDLPGYRTRSAPAIRADGSLVVVGYRYDCRAVDPKCGKGRLFLISTTGAILAESREYDGTGLSSPALDPDNNVYYFTTHPVKGGFVWKLDRNLVEITWRALDVTVSGGWSVSGGVDWCKLSPWCPSDYSTPGLGVFPSEVAIEPLVPSPALLADCGDLVATSFTTLRMRLSGKELWQNEDLEGITTAALGWGGRVYIGTASQHLEAWSQAGKKLWTASLGGYPIAPPALGQSRRDPADTAPLICVSEDPSGRTTTRYAGDARNDIYVPATDGYLYALDYQGHLRWKQKVGTQWIGAPVVIRAHLDTQEIVVVAGDSRFLRAYDRNGRPLWMRELDSRALGSPAVANGRIYVATHRYLYAFR